MGKMVEEIDLLSQMNDKIVQFKQKQGNIRI